MSDDDSSKKEVSDQEESGSEQAGSDNEEEPQPDSDAAPEEEKEETKGDEPSQDETYSRSIAQATVETTDWGWTEALEEHKLPTEIFDTSSGGVKPLFVASSKSKRAEDRFQMTPSEYLEKYKV